MRQTRFTYFVLASMAAVLLLWGSRSLNAHAAPLTTITVNSTSDIIADDGQCTLREAISAANTDTASGVQPGECPAGVGNDTITISAGTYTLVIAGNGENDNATGDLDINSNIVLNGAGSDLTIIQAGTSSPVPPSNCTDCVDRVFQILSGVVEINGVTVQNSVDEGAAGGIAVTGGTLTVNNSTVRNNFTAGSGGGLFNNGATLMVNNSTVQNNFTNGSGGGLYSNGGTLTVNNSLIEGNQAGPDGGGIRVINGGILNLTDSVIRGNRANYGGAVSHDSTGLATITNSTLRDNVANTRGGAIYKFHTMILTNSTVSGNSSPDGGSIFNRAGALTINNSTISGNWASINGGGIYNYGSSTLTINSSTIANNIADNDNNSSGDGGGIFSETNTTTIKNTILADNKLGNNAADDCADSSTSITANDSLIEVATGCTVTGINNIIGSDPSLGALADNGGSTFTHFLLPGSPAIDTGDCTSGPATDQRGVARPQDATCDIGAYEGGTLQCGIGTSSYTFSNQSNVTILVNSKTDLECLYVDEIPVSHPNATGASEGQNLRTGKYWLIGGLQGDGTTSATTFNVDLTLPYATASGTTRACKWLDGAGSGFGWNCGSADGSGTNFDPSASVTRLGVTAFSQWAVGDNVGPTAVGNLQADATPPAGQGWLVGLLVGLLGVGTAVVLRRAR